MPSIRAELICGDSSCINVEGIITIKEQICVFIPETRNYRDIITFEKGISSIDNLWDLKYKILDKTIEHIIVYAQNTDMETLETTETTIEEWKNCEYVFHGVYREVHVNERDEATSNIYLTIISNRGTMKINDENIPVEAPGETEANN